MKIGPDRSRINRENGAKADTPWRNDRDTKAKRKEKNSRPDLSVPITEEMRRLYE